MNQSGPLPCKLCGQLRQLGKSHIIPEAFFRQMGTDAQLITNTPNIYPRRVPVGVYDRTILCQACERKFQAIDYYAIDVLINRFPSLFQPQTDGNDILAYTTDNIQQDKLLRFFIATLWRASVSTHSFYSRVKLGPYEKLAAQVGLDDNTPIPNCFEVVLSAWNNSDTSLTAPITSPHKDRWQSANAHRFYFGRFVAYIKASRQPLPEPLSSYGLMRQSQLIIVAMDFRKTKNFNALASLAKRFDPKHAHPTKPY